MGEQTTVKQKKQILVVDDNKDMRTLLGKLLTKAGYSLVFAEDGQASLTQAILYQPDLILMDLSLPDIDGWEAVGHLRRMREFRSTPIIAVSAHISAFDEEHALAVGCTAYMGKPFNSEVLLQSIADHLQDRNGNR